MIFRDAACIALLALAVSAAGAAAQDDKTPAATPAPAVTAPVIPPQPPPAEKPGFLQQMKVWWDDSFGLFGKKSVDVTKDAATVAQDAVKGAVDATKSAATTIVKLPGTRMVDVREICAKAPNGAPDCETAAANGCRAKGFTGGRPLDVRTAEACDTTALAAGQTLDRHDCPIVTTVTRAICQ